MTIVPPSTSTPASNVSRADFERDDSANSNELEAKSLGDILKNSPAAALLGISNDESLPQEDDAVPTPGDVADENDDPENATDNDTDLDETDEVSTEEESEVEDEQDSTQDADLPTEEQIDWEYKVPVTIDGKQEYFTLEELRKGYATDKHLSQKGRELGELKKEVEKERSEKLNELVQLGTVFHQELSQQETELGSKYQTLSAEMEAAREIGDTYKARELKEERDLVQEKYWKARNSREEKLKKVVEEIQVTQQKQQQLLVENFNKTIVDFVPDFSPTVAKSVREFAISEGIPEALLESVYDPAVVKFINDYRMLKTKAAKGEVKRKESAAKATPVKKGTPQITKQKQVNTDLRNRTLSGEGSNQDHLDFLKNLSNVSKKL